MDFNDPMNRVELHEKPFTELEFNLLQAELNPIRHLLALLGAHHIFHVNGLRVNIKFSISRSSGNLIIFLQPVHRQQRNVGLVRKHGSLRNTRMKQCINLNCFYVTFNAR